MPRLSSTRSPSPADRSLKPWRPRPSRWSARRAVKVSVLDDVRIDLQQGWLDGYQLEVYLLIKLLKLGYRTTEVPVSKIYPIRTAGNTKMRPLVDWWHMLAPIFVVGLGIERLVHAGGSHSARAR